MLSNYLRSLYEKNLEASRRRSLQLVSPLQGRGVLLDAGCGNGKMAFRAMKAAGVHHAIGLELDPGSAKKAQSEELSVIRADLNGTIPLCNQTVDLVFAHHVFAHLVNHDRFVSEVHRVLRPGGYCIVSTENLSAWHNILSLVVGFQDLSHNVSSTWYLGNPFSPHYRQRTPPGFSPHYKIFTPRSLKDIFVAYGFQVERWIGTGSYPLPRGISKLSEVLDPWHSQFITIKARKS